MARHDDHDLAQKDLAMRKLFHRRDVLSGGAAVVAAGAIGAFGMPGAALADNGDPEDEARTHQIAGLWHTVVSAQNNSFPAFQAFELYAARIWIGSGQIDLQPASLSSSAWGIWEHVGHGRVRVVGRFWTYDAHANPTGFSAVDFTVTVSQDGNTYNGEGTLEFFDTKGTSLGPPTPIRNDGTRITFS
jgi:hypothetical protein